MPNIQGDNNGIARTANVLRLVAQNNRVGLRMIDIAKATGLDKSTVHRVLKAMTAAELLVPGADSRRYHLGPLLYELVGVSSAGFDLRALAESTLQWLAAYTESSVMLTVRDGLDGLCVRRISGPYPIQVLAVEEGARRPLGVGAGTQVLLAALPPAECHAVMTANFSRCLHSGVEETVVVANVRRIREMGYASQRTASIAAARTISIAILSKSGRPLASISALGITERMIGEREQYVLEAVRQAKHKIEADIIAA